MSSSIKSVQKSKQLLKDLSQPEHVATEAIEKALAKFNPELFAFIFNSANLDPSETKGQALLESLQMAILKLGFEEIKRRIVFFLIYSENVSTSMPKEIQKFASRLWLTQFEIGKRTSKLLINFSSSLSDEAFYLSMMQNLGIAALFHTDPKNYLRIIESERQLCLAEKEKIVFGFDHYQLGKSLVEQWSLPERHYRSILFEESGGEVSFEGDNPDERMMFNVLYLNKHLVESESKVSKDRRMGFDRFHSYNENFLEEAKQLISSDLPNSRIRS